MQVKESVSINREDTSISKSGQLDYAIPPSKIAALSSEEFVGMVADDPNEKMKLKTFHCEIINDVEKLKEEEASYMKIPVFREICQQEVMDNYFRVKQDVKCIIETQVARLKRERRDAREQREKSE